MIGEQATAAAAPKKDHHNQLQQSDAFAILTDDSLLTPIFEFVGLYEYRFVAILNKRFRELYSEFQKKRIHPTPEDSSDYRLYFSTSLTSTASVAESIDRAKLLMSDMKNRESSNHFIRVRKCKGDGILFGSFYRVVRRQRISGDLIRIRIFLRNAVAVRNGNLDMLQWLRASGCPWNEWTCAEAAGNGHLEVLQWLSANGCPWNKSTCLQAARNGHLEVLRWAHANGRPWGEMTHVQKLQAMGILRSCSGPVLMGVRGMYQHVQKLHEKVIWRSCSGTVLTGVRGMKGHVN